MWYKIERIFGKTSACYVEANSIKEAKELAEKAEWHEDKDEEPFFVAELIYNAPTEKYIKQDFSVHKRLVSYRHVFDE